MRNRALELQVDTTAGLRMKSLRDPSGHDWMPDGGSALFHYTAVSLNQRYTGESDKLQLVDEVVLDNIADITTRCPNSDLTFEVHLELPPGDQPLLITITVSNAGQRCIVVRIVAPALTGLQPNGEPADSYGMVPIELGTVRPLSEVTRLQNVGHFRNDGFSPTTTAFGDAAVYDRPSGRGLCLTSSGGAAVTFTVSADELSCTQAMELAPGERRRFAPIAVQTHEDGWQGAARLAAESRLDRTTPTDPAPWFREAGAIYNYGGEGGGGIYQDERTIPLPERIASFRELPALLKEAQALGTDILHLFDFWEGAAGAPDPPYWNKGDYRPRADLGGEAALVDGIEAVHRAGGKILLYLEPFIVYEYSELGRRHGEQWALRDAKTGELIMPYDRNYTMPPWSAPWQQHLLNTTRRYVGQYHADGVFLDSWGWQWNWSGSAQRPARRGTAADWNDAVLHTIDLVRQTARAICPDAVVFTESLVAPMLPHADGGLDASFAWNREVNGERLPASPLRYLVPGLNVFSAGHDRNELNQVFAAGAALALSPRWLPEAEHVQALVAARRANPATLIYGRLTAPPPTARHTTIAHRFVAEDGQSEAITVVNTTNSPVTERLPLSSQPGGWFDGLTGEPLQTGSTQNGARVDLEVEAYGVRLLTRQSPTESDSLASSTGTSSQGPASD